MTIARAKQKKRESVIAWERWRRQRQRWQSYSPKYCILYALTWAKIVFHFGCYKLLLLLLFYLLPSNKLSYVASWDIQYFMCMYVCVYAIWNWFCCCDVMAMMFFFYFFFFVFVLHFDYAWMNCDIEENILAASLLFSYFCSKPTRLKLPEIYGVREREREWVQERAAPNERYAKRAGMQDKSGIPNDVDGGIPRPRIVRERDRTRTSRMLNALHKICMKHQKFNQYLYIHQTARPI